MFQENIAVRPFAWLAAKPRDLGMHCVEMRSNERDRNFHTKVVATTLPLAKYPSGSALDLPADVFIIDSLLDSDRVDAGIEALVCIVTHIGVSHLSVLPGLENKFARIHSAIIHGVVVRTLIEDIWDIHTRCRSVVDAQAESTTLGIRFRVGL